MPERCPFQSTLDLLGRKHVLTLLWALSERRPRRFTELRDALSLNPATLAARLDDLEAAGVVASERFAEVPPRVEYDLTPAGADLVKVMETLREWSERQA
jgi:DNA-binding HxlR family transcriptional regulator